VGYYQRSVPYISRPRALAKSVEVLVWPGMTKVRNWVHAKRMDPDWRTEVETWLDEARLGGSPPVAAKSAFTPVLSDAS
jgi:hypothetical protein